MNNYELYHHGVKGMKWGVRRKLTGGLFRRRQASDDAKEFKSLSKKRPEEMSNAELLKYNQRAQLLNQYKASTKKKTAIASLLGLGMTFVSYYNKSKVIKDTLTKVANKENFNNAKNIVNVAKDMAMNSNNPVSIVLKTTVDALKH